MTRRTLALALFLALAAIPAVAQPKGKRLPNPGTVFHVRPDRPTWATCDVEFRDPKNDRWPSFFYGKPADAGSLTFDPKLPRMRLTLRCDQAAQKNGDQSRRVLGELIQGGKAPVVTLEVRSLGPVEKQKVVGVGPKGKKKTTTVDSAPAEAILSVGGREVVVKARTTFRWLYPRNSDTPGSVVVELHFALEGDQVGVKGVPTIDCRAGVTAYLNPPAPKKK